MNEHRFRYVYQHEETGDISVQIFTLDEIEAGIAKFFALENPRLNRIGRDRYTGLKDKEIYEGDIIRYEYYRDYGQSGEYISHKAVVQWNPRKAGFEPLFYFADTYHYEIDRVEVIGNIHDNPELLKREGK